MKPTIKDKIEAFITQYDGEVFLRSDFDAFGSKTQVNRALRALIKETKLIRISVGVYAKARINDLTGKPMPSSHGGFKKVALEALNRLGVDWDYSEMEKLYREGKSTQIPAKACVVIKGHFRRKIGQREGPKLYVWDDKVKQWRA